MQKKNNGPAWVCLLLISILGSSDVSAATLFPNRARGWNKSPTIVVSGTEGDRRIQLVFDAVDFWNRQFAELGSGFSLGAINFTKESLTVQELAMLSEAVLSQKGASALPTVLRKIDGDLIVVLSDGDFVSFSATFPNAGKRLVGVRGQQLYPLSLPNVARNVIAHELGHAIGLGHDDDPTQLMCGRPAPCRPVEFRSDIDRYFPLMEEEKQTLLKLYPSTWK